MRILVGRRYTDLDDFLPKSLLFSILGSMVLLHDSFSTISAFAYGEVSTPMTGINDLFQSDTFTANTKWLEFFNPLGRAFNFCLTGFGVLIAIIFVSQFLLTLFYWVSPGFWNGVDELKKEKKGLISYTFGDAFTGGAKSIGARGSDIVMDYAMLLIPNLKRYSEIGSSDANKDWTFSTWFIGTFPMKCFMLLLVSMTINGSIMQMYMTVVKGMGVVSDRFVQYDSEALVNNILNTGSNYKFALGRSGYGFDIVQGQAAQNMYKEVIKASKVITTEDKMRVGKGIEDYITQNLTKDAVISKILPKVTELTDEEWSKVKVDVIANNASSATNAVTVKAGDIGLENVDSSVNMHLYFTKKSSSDPTNYWKITNDED